MKLKNLSIKKSINLFGLLRLLLLAFPGASLGGLDPVLGVSWRRVLQAGCLGIQFTDTERMAVHRGAARSRHHGLHSLILLVQHLSRKPELVHPKEVPCCSESEQD